MDVGNKNSYSDVAGNYSEFYHTIFGNFFLDIFVNRVKDFELGSNLRLLDLGCGHCTLSGRLAEELNLSKVKAIDQSEEMIQESKNRIGEVKHVFDFSILDLEEDDVYFEEEYDIIIIQGLMCLMENPDALLQKASCALSDDGRIFLSYLPLHQYAFSDLKYDGVQSFEKTIDTSQTTDTDGIPISVFSRSEMKSHIAESDLSVEEEYPIVRFLNYLEPERREELLKDNYEILKEKEIEVSRRTSSHGLRNVIVLR